MGIVCEILMEACVRVCEWALDYLPWSTTKVSVLLSLSISLVTILWMMSTDCDTFLSFALHSPVCVFMFARVRVRVYV